MFSRFYNRKSGVLILWSEFTSSECKVHLNKGALKVKDRVNEVEFEFRLTPLTTAINLSAKDHPKLTELMDVECSFEAANLDFEGDFSTVIFTCKSTTDLWDWMQAINHNVQLITEELWTSTQKSFKKSQQKQNDNDSSSTPKRSTKSETPQLKNKSSVTSMNSSFSNLNNQNHVFDPLFTIGMSSRLPILSSTLNPKRSNSNPTIERKPPSFIRRTHSENIGAIASPYSPKSFPSTPSPAPPSPSSSVSNSPIPSPSPSPSPSPIMRTDSFQKLNRMIGSTPIVTKVFEGMSDTECSGFLVCDHFTKRITEKNISNRRSLRRNTLSNRKRVKKRITPYIYVQLRNNVLYFYGFPSPSPENILLELQLTVYSRVQRCDGSQFGFELVVSAISNYEASLRKSLSSVNRPSKRKDSSALSPDLGSSSSRSNSTSYRKDSISSNYDSSGFHSPHQTTSNSSRSKNENENNFNNNNDYYNDMNSYTFGSQQNSEISKDENQSDTIELNLIFVAPSEACFKSWFETIRNSINSLKESASMEGGDDLSSISLSESEFNTFSFPGGQNTSPPSKQLAHRSISLNDFSNILPQSPPNGNSHNNDTNNNNNNNNETKSLQSVSTSSSTPDNSSQTKDRNQSNKIKTDNLSESQDHSLKRIEEKKNQEEQKKENEGLEDYSQTSLVNSKSPLSSPKMQRSPGHYSNKEENELVGESASSFGALLDEHIEQRLKEKDDEIQRLKNLVNQQQNAINDIQKQLTTLTQQNSSLYEMMSNGSTPRSHSGDTDSSLTPRVSNFQQNGINNNLNNIQNNANSNLNTQKKEDKEKETRKKSNKSVSHKAPRLDLSVLNQGNSKHSNSTQDLKSGDYSSGSTSTQTVFNLSSSNSGPFDDVADGSLSARYNAERSNYLDESRPVFDEDERPQTAHTTSHRFEFPEI